MARCAPEYTRELVFAMLRQPAMVARPAPA
jgi:hypothetical protein